MMSNYTGVVFALTAAMLQPPLLIAHAYQAMRVGQQQAVLPDNEEPVDERRVALETAEAEWEDAIEAWRVQDARVADALDGGSAACSPEVLREVDEAGEAARVVTGLKRQYYEALLSWYGERYSSASTVLRDFQPHADVLRKQIEAAESEAADLGRRGRQLVGDRTREARQALDEIQEYKEMQVSNLRDALNRLTDARSKVQDERRIASAVRAKLVEILRSIGSEETLFDAYYRHQRASANLRCTAEGKSIIPLKPFRPGGGR